MDHFSTPPEGGCLIVLQEVQLSACFPSWRQTLKPLEPASLPRDQWTEFSSRMQGLVRQLKGDHWVLASLAVSFVFIWAFIILSFLDIKLGILNGAISVQTIVLLGGGAVWFAARHSVLTRNRVVDMQIRQACEELTAKGGCVARYCVVRPAILGRLAAQTGRAVTLQPPEAVPEAVPAAVVGAPILRAAAVAVPAFAVPVAVAVEVPATEAVEGAESAASLPGAFPMAVAVAVAAPVATAQFCSACGAQLSGSAAFCSGCGSRR